jgi:hypothetical protein
MHHPQHPDLDFTGVDVDMSISPLGDDFRCTESGPIDQITIWGSFFEDRLPPGGPESLAFEVAIHADIPAGVEERWSMPGRLLWSRLFEPGQYGVMLETDEALQGWFDPLQQYWEPENHRMVLRYDFYCDREPFIQEEGTIYWLVVRWLVPPRPEYIFGWKSTPLDLHWNDDAVFTPDPPLWFELRYPERHPWEGETLDLAFVIFGGVPEREFGDAPEGPTELAYPFLGVVGSFPTCKVSGPNLWIEHQNFGAYFGPRVDLELEGNAGSCPPPGCFPPWDLDECFADGDAGLLIPGPFTIDAIAGPPMEIPCPGSDGSPLGRGCQQAWWGRDIDIDVHNHMPGQATGFVNVLMDWDQDGRWGGSSACPGERPVPAPEHVLVDFPVPNGYDGPLSGLGPPPFLIGPRDGFVWARFSITERPVGGDWYGDGVFEDGESEDYMLLVEPPEEPTATLTRPPTRTPTPTQTRPLPPTATATRTRPPTLTPTPTRTRPLPPTATATRTRLPTHTPTPTRTRPLPPTATATRTRLPTHTPTPTQTRPVPPTATATQTRPPSYTVTPTTTRPPTRTLTPTATRPVPARYRLYLPKMLKRVYRR